MSLAEILPPRPRIKRRQQPFTCHESGGAFATIVAELYKKNRITARQAKAAQMFLNDLTAYHGSTGTGGYGERVDTSSKPGKLTGWTQAHINAQTILDKLWFHERKTLDYLITNREKARPSLADFGREAFGYSEPHSAAAAAIAKIGCLLDSISEHYLGVESLESHSN